MTGNILEDLLPYCLRWWHKDSWLGRKPNKTNVEEQDND